MQIFCWEPNWHFCTKLHTKVIFARKLATQRLFLMFNCVFGYMITDHEYDDHIYYSSKLRTFALWMVFTILITITISRTNFLPFLELFIFLLTLIQRKRIIELPKTRHQTGRKPRGKIEKCYHLKHPSIWPYQYTDTNTQ